MVTIIGDVHGERAALEQLLRRLGARHDGRAGWQLPAGMELIFAGDLVDRGPDSLGALQLALELVGTCGATVIQGNHEVKLAALLRLRARGRRPERLPPSRVQTWTEVAGLSRQAAAALLEQVEALPTHASRVLPDGRPLQVVHARWDRRVARSGSMSDRVKRLVRGHAPAVPPRSNVAAFPTARTPSSGLLSVDPRAVRLPERVRWVRSLKKQDGVVVFGHTVLSESVVQLGQALAVDTGAVRGGPLSAITFSGADPQVTQVRASRSWKTSALLDGPGWAQTALHPSGTADVRALIAEEQLGEPADYIAYLEMAAEAMGGRLNAGLTRAHARLHARASRPRSRKKVA